MSKPDLAEILRKDRIKVLEEKLPILLDKISKLHPREVEYESIKLRLDEYLLEYQERSGKPYNLRNVK